jgi:hypothetical protein
MARCACLVTQQQKGIAVTIDAKLPELLGMSGCLAFTPKPFSGSRPVTDRSAGEGLFDGLTVLPGQHQYFARSELLGDGWEQSRAIEPQLGENLHPGQTGAKRQVFCLFNHPISSGF